MTFDLERVEIIISDLEKYFKDLEELKIKTSNDLREKNIFYASSMIIFSAINRLLDLGEELLEAKKLGSPSTYKDIFWLLEKGKIIDHHIYEDMISLVKCRNILSHEYSEIKDSDIIDAIKKMGSGKKFLSIAKGLIKKSL